MTQVCTTNCAVLKKDELKRLGLKARVDGTCIARYTIYEFGVASLEFASCKLVQLRSARSCDYIAVGRSLAGLQGLFVALCRPCGSLGDRS